MGQWPWGEKGESRLELLKGQSCQDMVTNYLDVGAKWCHRHLVECLPLRRKREDVLNFGGCQRHKELSFRHCPSVLCGASLSVLQSTY